VLTMAVPDNGEAVLYAIHSTIGYHSNSWASCFCLSLWKSRLNCMNTYTLVAVIWRSCGLNLFWL